MAKIDFSQIKPNSNFNYQNDNQVGFFNLKSDGEEAVVRFMHDDVSDFEILTVHQITTADGKYRKVGCIRDPREPSEKCPFCANSTPIQQKIYIKILQYEKTADGRIIATPKVWERSVQYAQTLKSYLDNYGPLSDIICKVIRHGAPKDMKTTYEIVPNLNKMIYRDDIYVKDTKAFEGYQADGRVVMNKSFDEISTYLATGAFPEKVQENSESVEVATPVAPTTATVAEQIPVSQPMSAPVVDEPAKMPWEQTPATNSTSVFENRPTRRY